MSTIRHIFWEQYRADSLVYKFPSQEIAMGSVLTVNESQEAYFFRNGILYDRFERGRHELCASNLPLLDRLLRISSGGQSTFHSEVWFVSKTDRRNMYWGTSGLRIIDPYFEIPVKLYARGGYGIRISDGALFLKKLAGTMSYVGTDKIEQDFRLAVVESVKVQLSQMMKERQLNINELGSTYQELSAAISDSLSLTFESYGVELLNFYIEDINFDESDPGYQAVLAGISEQMRLKKLGVSYVQQRQLDIAQAAAGNPGFGNYMGIGMGISAGRAVGGMLNETLGELSRPDEQSSKQKA